MSIKTIYYNAYLLHEFITQIAINLLGLGKGSQSKLVLIHWSYSTGDGSHHGSAVLQLKAKKMNKKKCLLAGLALIH